MTFHQREKHKTSPSSSNTQLSHCLLKNYKTAESDNARLSRPNVVSRFKTVNCSKLVKPWVFEKRKV